MKPRPGYSQVFFSQHDEFVKTCSCQALLLITHPSYIFSHTIHIIWCDHTNRLYGENKCGNPYATAERSLRATFSQTCLILCISSIYLYRKSNFPQKNFKNDPVKYLSIQKIYRSNICFCGQGCIWDNIQIQPLAIATLPLCWTKKTKCSSVIILHTAKPKLGTSISDCHENWCSHWHSSSQRKSAFLPLSHSKPKQILIHNTNTWWRFSYVSPISYSSTAGAAYKALQGLQALTYSLGLLISVPLQSTYKWHPCKDDHVKLMIQSSVDQQVWGDEGFQNLKQILKRNYYKFNAPFWRIEWSRALTFCNLRTKTINAAFRLIHNSQNVMFWIHLVIYSNSVRKLWCIKQNWFFILPFSFTLCMLLLCKFFSNLTFN